MHTLAFDGRMGAAGDMVCASLIAAGADPAVLGPIEDALPVHFEVGETTKNGIRSTTVDVRLVDETTTGGHDRNGTDEDPSHDHSHGHSEGHSHGHSEDHSHDHSVDSSHHSPHAEGSGSHRTYPEVVDIVESMDLPESVESNALAAFELLGEAEASIHGTDLAETHFHEVGADDAIADVVGACLLLADLDVDRVVTTPLSAGGGDIEMDHGVYPVPAPAVVEIMNRAGLAIRGGPVDAELLTPTGAAILGVLAEDVSTLPAMTVSAAGYGAGRRSFPDHPNVLRALVGESIETDDASAVAADAADTGTAASDRVGDGIDGELHDDLPTRRGGFVHDEVVVLETHLDDASPEILGGLQRTLGLLGALDVTIVPTTMKKSRPGHLVTVVCKPADADAVVDRLARETGTLGIRESSARHRWIAQRSLETVTLDVAGESHEVPVKVASTDDGDVYDLSAEYDDAAALARETDLTVREVMRRAEAAARELLETDSAVE